MAARFFAVAVLVSTVVGIQTPARANSLGQALYAVSESGAGGRVLTELDPATLSSLETSASLSSSSEPAAFSHDASRLAFVQWGATTPSIRILQLPRMHWQTEVPLGLTTGTVLVRWLTSSRLLALAEQPDGLRALVVDAGKDRVVHTTRIPGHLADRQLVDVGRARAAVLLRARQALGPARVAVVSASGSARIVTLARIREGASGRNIYRPSLVADPSSDRAYVVGAIGEPAAAIDLRTSALSYHRPFGSGSAAGFSGAERMTVWLGRHRFAVAGGDDAPGAESRLLGLRVVDTRSWRARTLDPETDLFCVAGHSIVAHHLDGTLVVFGFDGTRRMVLSLADAGLPTHSVSNDRYLYLPSGDETLVADLAAGRVIGRRAVEGLQELLSPTYTLGAGCR